MYLLSTKFAKHITFGAMSVLPAHAGDNTFANVPMYNTMCFYNLLAPTGSPEDAQQNISQHRC